MKRLRILQLVHQSLVPDDKSLSEKEREKASNKTESDIYQTLKKQGHSVEVVGLYDDLKVLKSKIEDFKPHLAFNLLEEFAGEAIFDQNVVSYLELLKLPYTGCNPRGLMIARDKALTKEILSYHRIKVPKFFVIPRNKKVKKPKHIKFPLIVKCLSEEASLGISQASVVDSDTKLLERVEYLQNAFQADVIVEEFIGGREFYVGVIGNQRLEVLPVWELKFPDSADSSQKLATQRIKFNEKYREENNIEYTQAQNLPSQIETKIQSVCKRAYKALKLSGYARMDLRVTESGDVYVLEANPNPDIAFDEEFAESAQAKGLRYSELLERIMSLGLSWEPSL